MTDGAHQGYNTDTAHHEPNIDQELVMEMRRSYAPHRMTSKSSDFPDETSHTLRIISCGADNAGELTVHLHSHPYTAMAEGTVGKLTAEQLERSRAESLKDFAGRIMPFFNSVIVPILREGNRCLVVSHAIKIRTLIKQIDNISDQDIKQLSIPTGIPLIYRLDGNMKPVDPNCELKFRYMI